jgi:hypothetical protein
MALNLKFTKFVGENLTTGSALVPTMVAIGLVGVLAKFVSDITTMGMRSQKSIEVKQDVVLARDHFMGAVRCEPTYKGCGPSATYESPVDLYDSRNNLIIKKDGSMRFGTINMRAMCRTEAGEQLLRLEYGRLDKNGKPLENPLNAKKIDDFQDLYDNDGGPCMDGTNEVAEDCAELGGTYVAATKKCTFADDLVFANFQDKLLGESDQVNAQRAIAACALGNQIRPCNRTENAFARVKTKDGSLGACKKTKEGPPKLRAGACFYRDLSKGGKKKFSKTSTFAAGKPKEGWAILLGDGTKKFCVGGVYHSTTEPVPEWIEDDPNSVAVTTCEHSGTKK